MAVLPRTFADDIELISGAVNTFTGADGKIYTAAANEPAFAYDPLTLAPLGFQCQASRTNQIFPHIPANSTGVWGGTGTGLVTTAGAALDPKGGNNAALLREDATLSGHFINATPTGITGTSGYAFHGYAREAPGAKRYLALFVNGALTSNGVPGRAVFDLTDAGSFTTNGPVTAFIFRRLDGYYWIGITFDTAATPSGSLRLQISNVNNDIPSYTGDNASGFHTWGWQGETTIHKVPSTLIETTVAQVTRTVATRRIRGVSRWFNSGSWHVVVDYIEGSPITNNGSNIIAFGNLVDINDRLQANFVLGQLRIENFTGGVQTLNVNTNLTINTGQRNKIAVSYGNGIWRACVNGGSVYEISSDAPGPKTHAAIGHRTNSGNQAPAQLNYYRDIDVGIGLLSAAEMQARTAL